MTLHLSHEQLCDLLLADSSVPQQNGPDFYSHADVVEEHLRACLICSAELESLRDSLWRFRDASTSYANQQLAQSFRERLSIAPAPQSYLSQPLYWAAAAAIAVAALFPLNLHRQHAALPAAAKAAMTSSPTRESDEALLEDIDQKISADVPSPMEPLADPTTTAVAASSSSDQRKN
jgi:hypothetical protein